MENIYEWRDKLVDELYNADNDTLSREFRQHFNPSITEQIEVKLDEERGEVVDELILEQPVVNDDLIYNAFNKYLETKGFDDLQIGLKTSIMTIFSFSSNTKKVLKCLKGTMRDPVQTEFDTWIATVREKNALQKVKPPSFISERLWEE